MIKNILLNKLLLAIIRNNKGFHNVMIMKTVCHRLTLKNDKQKLNQQLHRQTQPACNTSKPTTTVCERRVYTSQRNNKQCEPNTQTTM